MNIVYLIRYEEKRPGGKVTDEVKLGERAFACTFVLGPDEWVSVEKALKAQTRTDAISEYEVWKLAQPKGSLEEMRNLRLIEETEVAR